MRFFLSTERTILLHIICVFVSFFLELSRALMCAKIRQIGETLINLKNVSLSVSRSAFAPPSTSPAHILVIFHVYRKEKRRKRELRQQQEFFMVYDDALLNFFTFSFPSTSFRSFKLILPTCLPPLCLRKRRLSLVSCEWSLSSLSLDGTRVDSLFRCRTHINYTLALCCITFTTRLRSRLL